MGALYVVTIITLAVARIPVALSPTSLRIQYGIDEVHRLVPICLNFR
jgi:hypothetical protein